MHDIHIPVLLVSINHCLGASGALVACAAAGDLDTAWVEEKFRSTVKRIQKSRFGAFSSEFDISRIFKVGWLVFR